MMHKKKKNLFCVRIDPLIFYLVTLYIALAVAAPSAYAVRLIEEIQVATDGLYFAGEKGNDYQFSQRITPHGDCLTVFNDDVYMTWYQGGMENRRLMLSRRKVGSRIPLKTIAFPDQHIGYRGDPTKGDSHNTAAVGICSIDGSIHLLYDMHAYSKVAYPKHHFNYRVSVPNAISVSNLEWASDLFSPKRNYLKAGETYERITYPKFTRIDDGRLLAYWRYRGSGNGDSYYAIYDGQSWSKSIKFNNGNQSKSTERYNIYGSPEYLHGQLHWAFTIRYANNDEFAYNNGFFYAYSPKPLDGQWFDIMHTSLSMPVENPEILKIGEPCHLQLGNRMTSSPSWTVTENWAIHMVTTVNGKGVHYYKPPRYSSFKIETGGPAGSVHHRGKKIILIQLNQGRIRIQSAPEGTNHWSVLYETTSGRQYRFFTSRLVGDKLYVYLMEKSEGDAQPLYLQVYAF